MSREYKTRGKKDGHTGFALWKTGHQQRCGAVNVPLSGIRDIRVSRDRPLYVYCLRGTRSRSAVGMLKEMGYTDVKSIGGIAGYRGKLER